MVGLRFGKDPVDTIAPKEWEAMYLAVADAQGTEAGRSDPDATPTSQLAASPASGPSRPDQSAALLVLGLLVAAWVTATVRRRVADVDTHEP